jgi:hypothetical protein
MIISMRQKSLLVQLKRTIMKINAKSHWVIAALSLTIGFNAHAQQNQPAQSAPSPSEPAKFSPAELEKLAAPIALHPDPLISIILPASVYPLEVVQAARFVRDTNNIPKVDEQPWDENVKAVAKFPSMIQKMNDDITWTMDLGQAFVEQQKELMDTIQSLRGKAQAAGVLKTTPQQVIVVTNTVVEKTIEQKVVIVTNTIVQIQPASPQIVYVPTYPPTIYYPPPVYVGPPPILTFAAGIAVGAIIANNCDWHGGGIYVGGHGAVVWGGGGYHGGGNVNVNVNRNVNINNTTINSGNRTPQKWQPDQSRMSSSGAAGTRSSTQSAQTRGWNSGTIQAAPATRGTTAAAPADRGTTPAARPSASTGAASAQPRPAPSTSRPSPSPSQSYNRPTPSQSSARPSPSTSGQSAFDGVSSSASTRQSSSRGTNSRGSGGGGRSSGGSRR